MYISRHIFTLIISHTVIKFYFQKSFPAPPKSSCRLVPGSQLVPLSLYIADVVVGVGTELPDPQLLPSWPGQSLVHIRYRRAVPAWAWAQWPSPVHPRIRATSTKMYVHPANLGKNTNGVRRAKIHIKQPPAQPAPERRSQQPTIPYCS